MFREESGGGKTRRSEREMMWNVGIVHGKWRIVGLNVMLPGNDESFHSLCVSPCVFEERERESNGPRPKGLLGMFV